MLDRDCQGYNCSLALFGTAVPIVLLLVLLGSPTASSPPESRCLEAEQNAQAKALLQMNQNDWARSTDYAQFLQGLGEARRSCLSGRTDEALARVEAMEQKLGLLEASRVSKSALASGAQ